MDDRKAGLQCEQGDLIQRNLKKTSQNLQKLWPAAKKMLGYKILCSCLNVKSFLYCIFGRKEIEEIKTSLATNVKASPDATPLLANWHELTHKHTHLGYIQSQHSAHCFATVSALNDRFLDTVCNSAFSCLVGVLEVLPNQLPPLYKPCHIKKTCVQWIQWIVAMLASQNRAFIAPLLTVK